MQCAAVSTTRGVIIEELQKVRSPGLRPMMNPTHGYCPAADVPPRIGCSSTSRSSSPPQATAPSNAGTSSQRRAIPDGLAHGGKVTGMSFALNEQQQMVQQMVRQWCERTLLPKLPALEAGEL